MNWNYIFTDMLFDPNFWAMFSFWKLGWLITLILVVAVWTMIENRCEELRRRSQGSNPDDSCVTAPSDGLWR